MKSVKFDFNDILIQPAVTSSIASRKEITPTYFRGLPLITAPMDTVVSENNYEKFLENKITVCLPRGEKTKGGNVFISYSLKEITKQLPVLKPYGQYLVDVANGHMSDLVDVIKLIKKQHPFITLMVGNIANPESFRVLSEAGADFIRVGIGNGNGCLTTQQTGIGYPMGSLVHECYKISCELDNPAKIVADGGMKDYSDIIKALALGADYVMVGSLLNKCIESAGDNYLFKHLPISEKQANWLYNKNIPIYKKFRGMSTKEVQKKWGREVLKTSEGVTRVRKVEYSLNKWVTNFEDYLKSQMSYVGARDLDEFIGKAEWNLITNNAFLRFKK